MNRRQFIAVASVGTVGLAGCLGDDAGDDVELVDDYHVEDDGEVNGTDENGYEMYEIGGEAVPLAPTTDVYEWYEAGDVSFADARDADAYDELRIEGAVLSPAPDGQSSSDPLADLSTGERIVTYCVCPHTLAGQRGASLIAAGYTEVYALDEGLQEWVDRGHPIESG